MLSQKRAEEVLEILKDSKDDRDTENRLVLLLDYERFEFIKVLRKNRQVVLYAILLARAENDKVRRAEGGAEGGREPVSGLHPVTDQHDHHHRSVRQLRRAWPRTRLLPAFCARSER